MIHCNFYEEFYQHLHVIKYKIIITQIKLDFISLHSKYLSECLCHYCLRQKVIQMTKLITELIFRIKINVMYKEEDWF